MEKIALDDPRLLLWSIQYSQITQLGRLLQAVTDKVCQAHQFLFPCEGLEEVGVVFARQRQVIGDRPSSLPAKEAASF